MPRDSRLCSFSNFQLKIDKNLKILLLKIDIFKINYYSFIIKFSLISLIERKAKKGKEKRVPMSDESVENNFKELVRANIIKDYPRTFLKDWIGDLSYQNYEAAREARNYNHRIGEIRQIVMDYCVLPLSSREIHQVAPSIRAVCIYGLAQHGKNFLVNAICSEVFINFFTPDNI